MAFNIKSIAPIEKVNLVRNALANPWRKLIAISVILLGLALFVAAEYGVANLIISNQYVLAVILLVGVVVLVTVIRYPFWGYVIWFVLSCYLRLFNNVLPRKFNFNLIMLGLITMVLLIRALAKKRPFAKPSIEEVFLILAFVYEYIIRHTFHLEDAVSEIKYLLFSPCVIYFIAKSVITQRKHIRWLVITITLTGFSWALMGIYEQYVGKTWLAAFLGVEQELYAGIRSVGPAGFYYLYGNMLILTILLCLQLMRWLPKFYLRFVLCIICLTTSLGLYYGYSRAPYLAFALSLMVMLFMSRRTKWIYGVCIAMLFAAVFVVIPIVKSSSVLTARFSASVSGRVHDNKTSTNMFKANYLFGVGSGKYREFVPKYVSHGHGVTANPITGLKNDYTTSHSEYFRTLCELGGIGFVLYFGTYLLFMRRMLKIRNRLSYDGIIGGDLASIGFTITLAALFTMITDQFEQFPFMYAIIFTVFAMLNRAEFFCRKKTVIE